MKNHPLHSVIIAFAVVTVGSVALMFGVVNALKYYDLRRAYMIEKAKADAAAKVIDLCETDCADFGYEIDNSEAYWYWSQIKDLTY